jgi:hypothetical protein
MTPYSAAAIATGVVEAEDEEELLEAWQFLHDSGLAYQLEGAVGRQAQAMIEEGIIDA